MNRHNLFYYPYASFTNAQLPLLKVAALYFDKLVLLDPVGASWATIEGDHHAHDAGKLLKDTGILQRVTPADASAKYASPNTEAICQDMPDRELLVDLCEEWGGHWVWPPRPNLLLPGGYPGTRNGKYSRSCKRLTCRMNGRSSPGRRSRIT